MSAKRVVFDFDIAFSNGGGIQGQDFRLDIHGDDITDRELADFIVADLRLLMVAKVTILNKRYLTEPHKRPSTTTADAPTLIDLSHAITSGMTTYPGLPAPVISDHLSRDASRATYAPGTEFQIGRIDMVANTGTYLDTPFHRYAEGYDLAGLPLERVVGVAGVLVDAGTSSIDADAFVDVDTWNRAVVIRTGWSRNFGTEQYLGDHPYVTADGARRLADGGAAMVLIDSANIDSTHDGHRPAHSILLDAGIPVIEHLTNLDQLPSTGFTIYAIPPAIRGLGTFPVRVVARCERVPT